MLAKRPMMRVLVTGGTGFIGKKLVGALLGRGCLVTVLTRDVVAAKGRLDSRGRGAARGVGSRPRRASGRRRRVRRALDEGPDRDPALEQGRLDEGALDRDRRRE